MSSTKILLDWLKLAQYSHTEVKKKLYTICWQAIGNSNGIHFHYQAKILENKLIY